MSAFTRASLRSEADQVRKEPLLPIVWEQFKWLPPASEVIIQFGRGSKEHFRDATHFWLVVLRYWFRKAAFSEEDTFFAWILRDKYTQCEEISFEEWRKIVQGYDFVETAHDFTPHGRVYRAWRVYDTIGEVAALAETQEEFTVFSWELYD